MSSKEHFIAFKTASSIAEYIANRYRLDPHTFDVIRKVGYPGPILILVRDGKLEQWQFIGIELDGREYFPTIHAMTAKDIEYTLTRARLI